MGRRTSRPPLRSCQGLQPEILQPGSQSAMQDETTWRQTAGKDVAGSATLSSVLCHYGSNTDYGSPSSYKDVSPTPPSYLQSSVGSGRSIASKGTDGTAPLVWSRQALSFLLSHHPRTGDVTTLFTILSPLSSATLGLPPHLGAIIHHSEIDGVPRMSWQYMKYLRLLRRQNCQPHSH